MKKVSFFLFVLISAISVLNAQIPKEMTYQGVLTDNGGTTLTGTYQLTFRIYNVVAGGAELWSEVHTNVEVSDGLFNVILGTVDPVSNPIDLAFNEQYWIGVQVDSDPELTPRMQLTSVGYSFKSLTADSASNIASNAVTTINIQDGAVTQAKLATGLELPVNVSARLSGDGTTGNPLDLNQQGAIPGQVLEWNGSEWIPGTDDSGGLPSGAAAGDLSGSYPDPMVGGLQGRSISNATPTTGQVLEWNGSEWIPGTDDSGGLPSGAAAGDLSGSYPDPMVGGLQGRSISNATPTTGQVLEWNGSEWIPGTDDSGGTPSGAAAGDLSGNYPDPMVGGLQGRSISNATPTTGQVLGWSGSAWTPSTLDLTGNTLDDAYDQGGAGAGRTITADSGPVNIAGTDGLQTYGPIDHTYSGTFNALNASGSTSYALYYLQNTNAGNGWGLSVGMANNSASSSSYGIMGWNNGSGYGVYGRATAANGTGVYGENSNNNNFGFLGGPTYAIYGDHFDGNFGYIGGSSYGIYGNLITRDPGDYAIYGVGVDAVGEDGTGYGVYNSLGGVRGHNIYGNPYTFGVSGYSYLDYDRSGGNFGGKYNGTAWGCMGYQDVGGTEYGVYALNYGSPLNKNDASVGIGIGSRGDLFGADIRGKIFGAYVQGNEFAQYNDGTVYKNDLDVHLQKDRNSEVAVLYTNVSTDVSVQTSGYAKLSSGKGNIQFDEHFKNIVSDKVPVVVTVTPIGNSKGVFVSSVDKNGFSVIENDNGKSDVDVAFIAIGRRAGYENPKLSQEVIAADYTDKIRRGLHVDGAGLNDGQGLYYENGKLYVGRHYSTQPETNRDIEANNEAQKNIGAKPTVQQSDNNGKAPDRSK